MKRRRPLSPLLAFLVPGVVQFPCTDQYRRKSRSLNNIPLVLEGDFILFERILAVLK